jgi:eukaryotic-like serine/threonine-protein kinase
MDATTPTVGCLEREALTAYVDRQLSDVATAHADAHVATCATCKRAISELRAQRSTDETVADEPITAPARSSGQITSRYELGRKLGAGGMGEVLLATDRQLGRDVAIKRMLVAPSSAAQARFLREARIQGRLDHPAIVPVHELADDSVGRPFFVMKRLTGTTLAEVIRRGASTRQKLLRAFADVCLAIEFAHSRGIVHRDLKPANIMLGDFGEVYVLDWGVARVLAETEDTAANVDDPTEPALTGAGAILGTPGYMSPEQMEGEAIDSRADVYALGCILFEILAGEPLWRAPVLLTPQTTDARPSQRAPDRDVPPELDALCVEATANDRDQRLPSARVLAERIERYLDGDRDVAARKQVAAEHLAAARTAVSAGDGEAERATAMREAGRALALDPTAGDAAELVGRLMLEPPRAAPAEVDAHVATLEEQSARKRSLLNLVTVLSYLPFIPVLLVMGVRSTWPIVLYVGTVLVDGAFMLAVARRRRPVSAAAMHASAAVHALLIMVIARLFSPFWLAPALATISTMMFTSDPRVRWSWVAAIMIGAVLAPWLLEVADVLPRTMAAVDGGMLLTSDMVSVHFPEAELALVLYVVFAISIMANVTHRLGGEARAALRTIELQAWHLRQLVPARR